MSVVLVCFPGAPKISEEALKKEEELDKYLETRVEGQHTHKNLHTFTSHITLLTLHTLKALTQFSIQYQVLLFIVLLFID